jgi:hypothetical protein
MEHADAEEMRVPKRHKSLRLHDQQAPPVGGSSDSLDVDLISRLPDAILGTRPHARTQAISRRWLPLWRSDTAPLNLVADGRLSSSSNRSPAAAVVSKILSDHPGPARRFSLSPIYHRGSMAEAAGSAPCPSPASRSSRPPTCCRRTL